MSILGDIRSKHREYDDLTDGQLAYKLYKAKYSDMPMGMFADKIGLSQDAFGEMIGTAKQSGYQPTSRVGSASNEDLGMTGLPRAALSGLTLGGSDEMVAGMAAAGRKALQGDERNLGDIYQQELEAESARIAKYKRTDPIKAGVAEFAGAAMIPAPVKGVKSAAATSAGLGGVSGFLGSEGDVSQRLESGAQGAFLGSLLGPAFYKGGSLLESQFGSMLKKRAQKAASEGAPAIEQLKREASDAYTLARSKGATINPDDYMSFVNRVINQATDGRGMTSTRSKLLPQTTSVINEAKSYLGKQIGIDDLDELRQLAQIPAGNFNNPNEQRVAVGIIRSIDDFVDNLTPEQLAQGSATDVGPLLKSARSAWQKMRKTEGVESIIEKSESYAGGLESGIKNQINAILRNDKKRKMYTPKEIEAMKEIVNGSPVGNLIGNISQLGLSATGGRNAFNVGSGLVAGGGAGFAVGGPAGAAIGAVMEMAGTTALRYVREMSMKNQLQLYRDLVASGKINEFAYKSPEALKLLQAIANRAGQATTVTTANGL